jgi:ATP-binding cassette subfamily F protein 3
MLKINNMTFKMMGRSLFENASIHIPVGAKAGLVGRNGTGKTTLFKMLTAEYAPESGEISLRKKIRIGQVAQEVPSSETSLIDVVLAADKERLELLEESETATDPTRIGEIHDRLNDIDAYSAPARASAILGGLGFDHEAQQRPCSDFSGGWRMRVALAAVLFYEPDLLMLDEPTNYLDMEGTLWLENYLQRYRHTVLIISHDRNLLNKVCNTIVHLSHKQLTSYKGNYDFFAKTMAEQRELAEKFFQKQEDKRKHMEKFVERFRAKASKARQAQSRLKALEKMSSDAPPVDESFVPLSFPSPEDEAVSPIINMESASVGYEEGKPILKNMDLRIDHDDRIALLGSNGNGKSTFAKLISERLQPMGGRITRARKLRIAFFAQHQLDELVPEQNAYEHLRAKLPEMPESKVRAKVAQFGLGKDKMMTKVKDLSGGEKARLMLGLITLDAPHLLILDEPTNHLDIETRQSLLDALNDFEGAVILIAHDRMLVEGAAERLWLVHDGKVAPYEGDMDDYRKLVLSGEIPSNDKLAPNAANADDSDSEDKPDDGLSSKERRRLAAQARKKIEPLRKELKKLEAEIAKHDQDLNKIDRVLANPPKEYSPKKIAAIANKRGEVEGEKAQAEERWLEVSSAIESFEG